MILTTSMPQVVFTATADWVETALDCGELEISYDTFPRGWEAAAKAAGIDADDPDVWVAEVAYVDDRLRAIRPGDFACCRGIGSNVDFVR